MHSLCLGHVGQQWHFTERSQKVSQASSQGVTPEDSVPDSTKLESWDAWQSIHSSQVPSTDAAQIMWASNPQKGAWSALTRRAAIQSLPQINAPLFKARLSEETSAHGVRCMSQHTAEEGVITVERRQPALDAK